MECSFIRDTLDIEPRLSSDGIGLAPPNRGSSHHKYKTSEGHVQNFPSPTFFRWNIQPHSTSDRPYFAWQGFFIWLRSKRTCPSSKHGIPQWYPIALLQRANDCCRWLRWRCSISGFSWLAHRNAPSMNPGLSPLSRRIAVFSTIPQYSQDFVLYRMMGSLVYIHLCFTG